jgi:membrane associated rhomboid family serine protease
MDLIRSYLERDASPVAIAAATTSSALPEALREVARSRKDELALTHAGLDPLTRHFDRLITWPKNALLRHIGSPSRIDPVKDRLDLLAEVAALRQAQADIRTERHLSRSFQQMFTSPEPFAVWCLIAACFAVHLALGVAGRDTSDAIKQSLRLETGLDRPWTLFSYAFVHLADLRHILLNMLAFASLGPVLERVLGPSRFVGFFLGAAAFGGLISVLAKSAFGWSFATVGASAAVAGLAGLGLSLGIWFSRRHGRIPLRYTASTVGGGLTLVSNFAIGAASGGAGVDHAAHIGGLLFGVGVAVILIPSLSDRASHRFAVRARA